MCADGVAGRRWPAGGRAANHPAPPGAHSRLTLGIRFRRSAPRMNIRRVFGSVCGVVLAAACATLPHSPPVPPAKCDDFTGSYIIDPSSCRYSRGALSLSLDVAKYPDESVIEPWPVLFGIHQDGCESLAFVARGLEEDRDRLRRSFSVTIDETPNSPRWQASALVKSRRESSNLPPPIAIAGHGHWYWSLRHAPNGRDLIYRSGYAERGLFFFVPYSAHREINCTLTRQH